LVATHSAERNPHPNQGLKTSKEQLTNQLVIPPSAASKHVYTAEDPLVVSVIQSSQLHANVKNLQQNVSYFKLT